MAIVKQNISKSKQLYDEATKVLPGGVSRNTIHRQPHPSYVDFASGCRVTDVDGITRIDFANNMAALIHGHAHPAIVEAVSQQLARGTAYTMATEVELRFAQELCERVPGFDKVRFVNSGTEAVMVAIKAARALTGRPKMAKSEGAYHGTYDYAEVSQKSKPENWGDQQRPQSIPVAQGTPQRALDDVIVFPFNDIDRTIALLDENADQLACVVIDPLPHRVGLISATHEFVTALREWTTRHGVVLIFDEVITFRLGFSGAQQWYDVQPDLTTMGKIIGGGFPVGAVAGTDEIMSVLDPRRHDLPFPHSGTFSANPVTMTAGLTAMQLFDREAVDRLNQLGQYTRDQITNMIAETGIEACVTGAGSLFRVHLKQQPPVEYRTAFMDQSLTQRISQLVDHLYHHGFLMINTCTGALSTVMTEDEIDQMVDTLRTGLLASQD